MRLEVIGEGIQRRLDCRRVTAGRGGDAVSSVPLAGRKDFWTVFVDAKTGDVLGFIALDSF